MIALGIDTSSPATSIALLEDGEVRALFHREHDHPPSDAAFAILDELLRGEGLRPRDLDLFAACEGPGSFTGLRIGLGMAKTFAYALGRPVVGIDAVSATALGLHRGGGTAPRFGVVVPGFKKTNFVGLFRAEGERLILEGELDYADGADELAALIDKAKAPFHAPRALAWEQADVTLLEGCEALAISIARLAAQRAAADELPDFDAIQPRYLKPFNVGAKARGPEDLR